MGHCGRRLGQLVCLCLASPVYGQLPPVGVPAGVVRVELDGSIQTYSRRFEDGQRESYAADLISPALGSDRISLLTDAETRIGRIIGDPTYRINLGSVAADALVDVGTGFLGLSLGLTNQITIFGRIPLVRSRVQTDLAVDPAAANAGLSPGPAAQLLFFDEFDDALSTLSAKLAAGDYDADPSRRALAQATLSDASALRADLFALLADPATASPALPATPSPAGAALVSRIVSLQSTLAGSLDVPGFALTPELPADPVDDEELGQVLTSPEGTGSLRLGETTVTFRGDAEAGASLTLIDRWDRGGRRGGLRAAVSGLVRFPTGRRDRSDHPLDVGTGDGQTDVQGQITADLGSGQFGARLSGTYLRQLPSNVLTRVASPSQPLVGPSQLALVRRDPGDYVAIGVRPFYRLARTLGLQAAVEHWSRTADEVSYASPDDALPGVDPAVLAEGTRANATLLSVGITYSNLGRLRPGGTGLPVDAGWSYERVLRAGGGRVPDTHTVRGFLQLYFDLW